MNRWRPTKLSGFHPSGLLYSSGAGTEKRAWGRSRVCSRVASFLRLADAMVEDRRPPEHTDFPVGCKCGLEDGGGGTQAPHPWS
eukprot:11260520-Heterocapsa_arctica.AAC.1